MKFSDGHLQQQFWNNFKSSVTINVHFQTIIKNWWLLNLWMMHNPVIKRILYLIIDFKTLCLPCFNLPQSSSWFSLFVMWFSNSDWRIVVFFFTSNVSVKRHSDFIALVFLTGFGVMGDLGLLLVNNSGVKNHSALMNIFELLMVVTTPRMLV